MKIYLWLGGLVTYWVVLLFFAPLDVVKYEKYFKEKRDWREITNEDTIRVLFLHHPADIFVHNGTPKGFCYELVKGFAQKHNLFIKIDFVESDLEGLRKLSFENWDLMAIPYPAIYPSFPGTTYTEPLFFDDFILYCSDSFQDSSNLEQFDSIRKACCILPYQWDKFILHSFFSDICVCIKNVSWKKLRENFICSDTLRHLLFLGPQKWMSFLIGFKKKNVKSYKQIPFCWVVRIDAAAFIHEINSWIKNQKKTGVINILLTKYYNYVFPLANPLSKSFHSFYSSTLSIYDDIIKKYAGMIGLEWLLAASLIYEESKFQTKLTSRSGAYGIMQLMPFIMERYGIDTSSSVDKQIYVGFLLLSEFNKVFDKFSLPPSVRDRVIITAYNMGFFPLKKCIELIQKKQSLKEVTFKQILDCLENNQEGFRLPRPMLKQGKVFVSNIFERYQIYRELYD